jgi:hypothetical protein
MRRQERDRTREPCDGPLAVEPADHGAGEILVRRRAAVAAQHVHAQGEESVQRHPPRHVLDMRVEAAVLVDDDHRGQTAGIARAGEIAGERAVRPRPGDAAGGQARIVGRHDRCLGRVGRQQGQHRGRRRRPARQHGKPVKEGPAVHAPVGEPVIEVDDRLRDGHGFAPRFGPRTAGA